MHNFYNQKKKFTRKKATHSVTENNKLSENVA